MCAFSVTSVPLCRSHTEMYLNCLHSQYAIVNHISDIDTANMTLGKRGKTIVHRFYYKHDQLAERAALQPHLIILLLGAGIFFTIKAKFVQIRMFIDLSALSHSRAAIRTDFFLQLLSVINRFQSRTGNIAGISTAICLGGSGAVFWMWHYGYSRKRICIYRKYACSNLQTQSKGRKFLRRTCILYSGRFEEALDRRPFRSCFDPDLYGRIQPCSFI